MKPTLSLFFLLIGNFIFGQDIAILHNWSHTGRDIELGYDHYINKHVFHIGINFFQNEPYYQLAEISRGGRQLYAEDPQDFLGFNLAYKRSFTPSKSAIEFLLKAEIQVFSVTEIWAYNATTPEEYAKSKQNFSLNNSLGLDLKVQLFNQLYLTGGAEGGIFISDNDDTIPTFGALFPQIDWELCNNFSIGLAYRLNRK